MHDAYTQYPVTIVQDRESYTDDQDRESYTEEDRTEVRT